MTLICVNATPLYHWIVNIIVFSLGTRHTPEGYFTWEIVYQNAAHLNQVPRHKFEKVHSALIMLLSLLYWTIDTKYLYIGINGWLSVFYVAVDLFQFFKHAHTIGGYKEVSKLPILHNTHHHHHNHYHHILFYINSMK